MYFSVAFFLFSFQFCLVIIYLYIFLSKLLNPQGVLLDGNFTGWGGFNEWVILNHHQKYNNKQ